MPRPDTTSLDDKDAAEAPIPKPEAVEDRPNVSVVEPGDYPEPATIAPSQRDPRAQP